MVASPTFAEFVASPLTEAFRRRFAGPLEVSAGVAVTQEMGVLVGNRLADVAIGPRVADDPGLPVVSEPIFRYRLVVVTAGQSRLRGTPQQWRWLVDPSGTDPDSDTGQLLAALADPGGQDRGVPQPDRRVGRGRRRGRGRAGRRAPGQPSSCAGASCPWSTCRARRWTGAGT